MIKANHKIVAALAGAILLVVLMASGAFIAFDQMKEAAAARKQSNLVLSSANGLLSALKDAETGQRGYLLTGDEAFLQSYLAVRDGIVAQQDKLRQLTRLPAGQKHLKVVVYRSKCRYC